MHHTGANAQATDTLLTALRELAPRPASETQSVQDLIFRNADVVRWVKAGASESVIVASIHYSQTDFDTSASALVALKREGVPDKVLAAISQTRLQPPDRGVPKTSSLRGVYVREEMLSPQEAAERCWPLAAIPEIQSSTTSYVFVDYLVTEPGRSIPARDAGVRVGDCITKIYLGDEKDEPTLLHTAAEFYRRAARCVPACLIWLRPEPKYPEIISIGSLGTNFTVTDKGWESFWASVGPTYSSKSGATYSAYKILRKEKDTQTTSPPAPAASSSPTTRPARQAAPSSEIAAAQASGKVWVNTDNGIYHKAGRWYGKTKNGKFMTEAEAKAAGYKEAVKD